MSRFLIQARYSSGAWARMVNVTDDRSAAARALFESLGGSLDGMWWDVDYTAAIAMTDLPDSISAAAVLTALSRTGSFMSVEAHELLNQGQLHDALLLAKDVSKVYSAPGSAAIEREHAG